MIRYIISLCLLGLILGACSDKNISEPNKTIGIDDEIILSMNLPKDELRASFSKVDASLDMQTLWSARDEVHFFAEQEGLFFDLGKNEVFDIKDEGKNAKIKVSTGAIVRDRPFTLYGVYKAKAAIGRDRLAISGGQEIGTPLRLFNPPLYCKVDIDNLLKYNGDLPVKFHHYGIYELTHFRNSSKDTILVRAPYWRSSNNLPEPKASKDIEIKDKDIVNDEVLDMPNLRSYSKELYNTYDDNTLRNTTISSNNYGRPWAISNYEFNLHSGKIIYGKAKAMEIGPAIKIAPGKTKSFVSWTVLSYSKELTKSIVLRAIIKEKGKDVKELYSQVYNKASDHPLHAGNSYHLTATWDGKNIRLGEVEPFELELSSVNLEVGKTKDISITKGKALRIENDREDIVVATIKDAGKKISLEAKAEGNANIKVYNENEYISLEIRVSKAQEEDIPDPNIPWENISTDDYELSADGLTLLKWKNKNTQHLDMNSDPKLKKVTKIGWYALHKCKSLKNINITNSVKSIEYCAFSQCESLKSINIPNSVKSIGDEAFSYCKSITNINIPKSVTSIGKRAFYYCTSLKSINIPNSVKSIGWYAFYYCTNLESIDIPNSITSIVYQAFNNCRSLKSINIPSSVTSIESTAFAGCENLKSINIPNSVKSIGDHAFYECTSLKSINIPNSVKSIGVGAFYGCTSLRNINIPSSVTSIKRETFSGCTSLISINIPNSVTSIGEWAFKKCTSLNSITLRAPQIIAYTTDILNNTPKLENIYVPANLVEGYKNANGWSNFADKIKAIED